MPSHDDEAAYTTQEGNFYMLVRALSACILALTAVLTGCATRTPMAFESDDAKWTEKSKPVLLMTATVRNLYRPSFRPRLLVVHVEKPNAKEASDRFNFVMDEKSKIESDDFEVGNNYLIRLELDPGQYEIRGLTSMASSFPVHGTYFAPLHSNITVGEPAVYYLGHVHATVRERKDNEFKAGSSIPLIDQAVAGASGGTFDIDITDNLDKDEALFRAKFPALAGLKITKAVLPAFDRAKAQAWWEAH